MSEQEIDLGIGLPRVSDVVAGNIKMPTTQYGVLVDGAIAGALDSQLAECLSEFGINGLSSEELFQAGIEELNRSVLHTCRAGFAFWAAQESIKAAAGAQDDGDDEVVRRGALGTFIEWIEGAGLAKERVYEAIRIAKFFSRLPIAKRAQMLKLGKKPVLLLAKMPQEVIDQAAESGKDILGEAETMTYDQLRDLLKSAERRNQQLNAEVEHRDALINKFKQRDNRDYTFLPQTHVVREECLAYQAECEVALNSLQMVFEAELDGNDVTERQLRIEQLWITTNAIAARAGLLLSQMRETSPIDLPEHVSGPHTLTDDECQRWRLDYQLIERKHEAAKAKREEARPKRPGRPVTKGK